MIKNYFTIAFRNFRKHKLFSAINVAGLAIGISAAMVIYLIVHYEFSFDHYQKDRDRIYRVISIMHFPDQLFKNSGTPFPIQAAMKNEVTGTEIVSRFQLYPGNANVTVADHREKPALYKKQPNIIFADNDYFKLIAYRWLAGSPAVLNQPFQVVLTESRAKTYFPGADVTKAIGKTITYNDSIKVSVAGIAKDLDEITDFTFKEFISFPTLETSGLKNNYGWDAWGSITSSSQLFVKLRPGVRPAKIEKQLTDLRKKNAKNSYLSIDHLLQPLSDIHFNADYDNFDQRQGHKPTLYGLLALGIFLLILGCINFINLTTAQSVQRSKEIGIRKTMGSTRNQLMIQFLSETFFITLLAGLLSFALVPWVLKIFADYIRPEVTFSMLTQSHAIVFVGLLILVVSAVAGFYPSLVLSGYNPSLVLKNQAFGGTGKTRKAWLRKTLTVSQFVIAQFFIIASLMVGKQISYTLNKDMGFKKDAIIFFDVPYDRDQKDGRRFVLQQNLNAIPGIDMISLSGTTPADMNYSIQTMKFNEGKKDLETTVEIKEADTNYFKLYHMKLLAGRYLRQSDTVIEYLINNNYASFLGFKNPADIIGKTIERGDRHIPIVGVLADFNSRSLHTGIKPLAYTSAANNHSTFHIALKKSPQGTAGWKTTIAAIEKAYRAIYPEQEEFHYHFFDDSIAKFYETEQNIAKLLAWATGLAIFISCLGLLGLVIFTTHTRTKEIGVRKVLGASVTQIVSLLSKDFMQLVIIGFIIAAPLAWIAINEWLLNFAYRTLISWWVFVASGMCMVIIAFLTLSFQTFRSASANPVKALRTE